MRLAYCLHVLLQEIDSQIRNCDLDMIAKLLIHVIIIFIQSCFFLLYSKSKREVIRFTVVKICCKLRDTEWQSSCSYCSSTGQFYKLDVLLQAIKSFAATLVFWLTVFFKWVATCIHEKVATFTTLSIKVIPNVVACRH